MEVHKMTSLEEFLMKFIFRIIAQLPEVAIQYEFSTRLSKCHKQCLCKIFYFFGKVSWYWHFISTLWGKFKRIGVSLEKSKYS